MYHVYILRSLKNKKRYIGFTSKDPKIRLQEHNEGFNSFTRYNGPFILIYSEAYTDESFARKCESYFKTGHGRKYSKEVLFL